MGIGADQRAGRRQSAVLTMATYILLRIEDDSEADDLLCDVVTFPHSPLLTPTLQHTVHAEIVAELDPSDGRLDLATLLRRSFDRAGELAAQVS